MPYDDFYDDGFYDDDDWMSDAQAWNRISASMPERGRFSTDALLALPPEVRGIVADAVSEGEGRPYDVYSTLNDDAYQRALLQRMMPQYDAIAEQYGLDPEGDSGSVREQNMRMYQNAILENFFASAAPSMRRNMGQIDWLSQRYGAQPYPGGDLPGYEGVGFDGLGPAGEGADGGLGAMAQEWRPDEHQEMLASGAGRSPIRPGAIQEDRGYADQLAQYIATNNAPDMLDQVHHPDARRMVEEIVAGRRRGERTENRSRARRTNEGRSATAGGKRRAGRGRGPLRTSKQRGRRTAPGRGGSGQKRLRR